MQAEDSNGRNGNRADSGRVSALRSALVAASRTLAEKGLVARTWGNLSLRVDEHTMLITPSGIPYEKLGPDDLAVVNIASLEWQGRLKPSSEKGLHAMIYEQRPAVQAVIHTHQPWAAALASARRGLPAGGGEAVPIGQGTAPAGSLEAVRSDDHTAAVPIVPYALPTTKALTRAVRTVSMETKADAFILANHGALCLGRDLEEAIARAVELEWRARARVVTAIGAAAVTGADNGAAIGIAAGDGAKIGVTAGVPPSGDATGPGTVSADAMADEVPGLKDLVSRMRERRPSGTVILVAASPFVLAAAQRGRALPAVLDDLAQLSGPSVPCVNSPDAVRGHLERRSLVLVRGVGCLCTAENLYEAKALTMVVEKAALAFLGGEALGGAHRIARREAVLMRLIYRFKYSRKGK